MAGPKEVVMQQLKSGQMLLDMLTADLSDSEYFVPASKGTNHVGWILGHLGQSEDWMISVITKCPRGVSEAHEALFSASSECLPDATVYPPREALDEMFLKTGSARYRHCRNLTPRTGTIRLRK